jgi:hypothetical protein
MKDGGHVSPDLESDRNMCRLCTISDALTESIAVARWNDLGLRNAEVVARYGRWPDHTMVEHKKQRGFAQAIDAGNEVQARRKAMAEPPIAIATGIHLIASNLEFGENGKANRHRATFTGAVRYRRAREGTRLLRNMSRVH